MPESAPAAGGLPRLAFVYHPRSFGTMAIAEAAREICELTWVIDSSEPEMSSMARLLRRLGEVVDVAGMSLADAAAAIEASRPRGILALADGKLLWTARVAELIGLPFLTPAVAEVLTDKHAQRAALARAGLPVPGFWRVPADGDGDAWSELERAVTFPAVLKPRRGEGSRDTALVGSMEELREMVLETTAGEAGGHPAGHPAGQPDGQFAGQPDSQFAGQPDSQSTGQPAGGDRELVLEEYLRDRPGSEGREFADYVSVESVVSEGRISHLAITGRFPPADPFRETGFFIPCAYREDECEEIAAVAEAAVRAVGIERGLLHTEVKLTPDGPRVIELNGRIGGGVPEMLAQATGVELLPMALRVALGEPVVFESMPACARIGFLLYVQAPSWMRKVRSVEGLEGLREQAGVQEVILNRGPGRAVDWRSGNHGHVFSVLGSVGDHERLLSIERYATQVVEIHGD